MISRYNKFKEKLLLESIINETFLYYSPEVRKVISVVNNDIAKDLLSIEMSDVKPDVTFIGLDKDGYLSFTTARNAGNTLNKVWTHVEPERWFNSKLERGDLESIWKVHIDGKENDVYKKSRSSIKIGKFINKLFPGKYSDKQVEEFVNAFKGSIGKSTEVFELVDGTDIEFWYDHKNYYEESGTLGNSCMAKKKGIFDIYTKNPEVCRMLILKDGDKILGRALVWKLDSIKSYGLNTEGIEYFMDRQYYINESDVVKFRNYAKEQKTWVSKAHNNHHSFETIIVHRDDDKELRATMTVKVKKAENGRDNDYDYGSYPYLDTFRRFDPRTGILYNDDDQDSDQEGCYILEDTTGGRSEVEGGVWSEWHDRTIPEDEAVYSNPYGDWLIRDYAVLVDRGSRRYHGWYHQDDDDIVYDENIEEYIHQDDAVYSEPYGCYILDETAVMVIIDIESDGDVSDDPNWYPESDSDIIEIDKNLTWFEFLSDKFSNWNDFDYIVKSEMIRNNNDEWIPKMFKISEYKISDTISDNAIDITGIEYLSEIDAEALGYKVDKNDSILSDLFQYHKDIEELLPELYNRLTSKYIEVNNKLDGKGQLRIKFDDFNEDEYLRKLEDKQRKLLSRLEEIENDEFIESDITITRNI